MFEDLRVVELASVLAGPSVGSFFAELGAKVIKIENPKTKGDVTRSWKFKTENPKSSVSAYYASANYSKKVRFLDITDKKDLQKLYREVKKADIVLCNYKQEDDKKLKVDYERIKKKKNDIIYVKLTGFGEGNKRPAYDVVLQAEAGYMFMNGTADSGPVKMPVAMMDILAAHQMKEAILCALLKKERTGKGSNINVSLYAAAISALANQASSYLMLNHIPQPKGTLHPTIAPYGELFKTADDRLLVLALGNNKHFFKFCELLNYQKLTKDRRFKTNYARVKNRKSLAKYFKEAIKNLHSSTIEMWIHNYDLPIGFIKNLEEVFRSEEAQKMVLEETIENVRTKRVKNIAFDITD